MITPAPPLAPLSSRLIRWRSTRICRSSSLKSPIETLKARFICGVAETAARQAPRISSRCAGFAQPGKAWPARLRASRTRVISTIAVLLLDVSVSSDGVSMSEEIVMCSALDLLVERLFDLVDFIASAGGVFVALGLDCLREVQFEFRQPIIKGFALESARRNLPGMRRAVVHVLEHRHDDAAKSLVARRASERTVLLEVALRESAMFATHAGGNGRLRVEGGFEQQVGQGKTAGVRHPLGLRTALAKIHLVNLVVHDLGQVNRRRLRAK